MNFFLQDDFDKYKNSIDTFYASAKSVSCQSSSFIFSFKDARFILKETSKNYRLLALSSKIIKKGHFSDTIFYDAPIENSLDESNFFRKFYEATNVHLMVFSQNHLDELFDL